MLKWFTAVFCVVVIGVILCKDSPEGDRPRHENKKPGEPDGAKPVMGSASYERARPAKALPDRDGPSHLARLTEANKRLQEENTLLQGELAELRKPFGEDILSSTLKTRVGKGEVLVTGGYQTADGRFQYTMVKPEWVQSGDGSKAIRLVSRQFALTREAVQELNLDSLITRAGNTLQHGEVWSAEALVNFLGSVHNNKGIDVMTAPTIIAPPDEKADIGTSDYRLSITPRMSDDGSGFDMELRVEQSREPKAITGSGEAGP